MCVCVAVVALCYLVHGIYLCLIGSFALSNSMHVKLCVLFVVQVESRTHSIWGGSVSRATAEVRQ